MFERGLFDATGVGVWDKELIVTSPEYDVTGMIVEEIRIQKILDFDRPVDETPEAFLERYEAAKETVRTTPIPDNFDVRAELEAFSKSIQEIAW